jgi:hypothetical protein
MRTLKTIFVGLGFLSVAGVLLWAGLWITAYYMSGANYYWLSRSTYEFYTASNAPYGETPVGQWLWGYASHLISLWMLAGAVGVFIFGFYFAFAAKTPIQRILTALCILCVWVGVVVCFIPGLI